MMKNYTIAILLFTLILGSCKLQENIQDGQMAFDLKKYALASTLLQKDFNKEGLPETKARLAFQIAQSFQFNNEVLLASKWYQTAIEWDYGSDAILAFAKMLKVEEKYAEAIQQFAIYLKEEPYRRPEITSEINACEAAIQWRKKQENEFEQDTYVSQLTINSIEGDFSPVLYKDSSLLFISSRENATGEKKDSWTTNKFYDIYETNLKKFNQFTNPQIFTAFNSEFNDGGVAFNADFSEIIFTRCGSDDKKIDDYCNLFFSTYEPDAGWTEPSILQFFEDTLNVGNPCLSPDGQALYFCVVHPDGYGGSDIYMSKRNFDGWDAPINLGPTINTKGNEIFPYFSPQGMFYFASDGHPGMGGLDLFSAKINKGKFTAVTNLEFPINSGADDFGLLLFDPSTIRGKDTLEIGYFSSARKGGMGGDDIYLVVKKTKKLRPVVYALQGIVRQKIYEDSLDVNSAVVDTLLLKDAIATIAIEPNPAIVAKYSLSGINSSFKMVIDGASNYKITGIKEGYFNEVVQASAKGLIGNAGDTIIVFVDIVLDKKPIASGSTTAEIKLKNIYYDYADTTLRAESFPELDQLVKLLNENPELTIQINSHTDARGNDKYNLKLSQGRANSVVDYLISKGIVANRLFAKGFGESLPDVVKGATILPDGKSIAANSKLVESLINQFKASKASFEFLHQLNRRTTFAILSDSFKLDSDTPDRIKVDEAPQNVRDQINKID